MIIQLRDGSSVGRLSRTKLHYKIDKKTIKMCVGLTETFYPPTVQKFPEHPFPNKKRTHMFVIKFHYCPTSQAMGNRPKTIDQMNINI